MHEEGYPFLGGGLIVRLSAAQLGRTIGEAHEAGRAEGGDEAFVLYGCEVLDAIFHGISLKGWVGHRLSEGAFENKGKLGKRFFY